jgi:hypothetical protein
MIVIAIVVIGLVICNVLDNIRIELEYMNNLKEK